MNPLRDILDILIITLIILVTILSLAGCADPTRPTVITPTERKVQNGQDHKHVEVITPYGTLKYEIVVIDGCQYIYIPTGNATVMSHKGNCNNPVHLYRIEKGN